MVTKMRIEYKALMEYIKRGLLGDVKKTVLDIRLLPQRLDWTSIVYRRDKTTALHVVCTTKNDYMLNYLIDEGLLACLEQENLYGDRPLHFAAKHSDVFAVNKFIEMGVKVNVVNRMKNTPLMLGASSRDLDSAAVVRSLLEEGSNSALINQFGQTATHMCSGLGTRDTLELLLDHNSSTVSMTRIDGRSPLHSAAHHGRQDLLETLLMKGNLRDSNVRALCGATPVMDAVRQGHVSTAAAITTLWPNTDLQARDESGRDCLQIAAEGGFIESIKFLVEKCNFNPLDKDKNGLCSLHIAAGAGRCEAVKLLVKELQVPIDVLDNNGKTPLWWAVHKRQTESAEQLLQLGATPLPRSASASSAA
ncbi:Ankyrin repeat-containing domain [Trinorchestia longiramus]|nr:Ankyrin repeat-containing domain [Trinorchestia longiramus]